MHKVIHSKALDALASMPDASVNFIYVDPPFFTQKKRKNYDDRWADIQVFTDWLKDHVAQSYRVLADDGAMVIHLDYRAIHYVRVMMDSIFGYHNMLNEIIWNYNSGGAGKKTLARKHDNLLWYVKDVNNYTFNVLREPYATPNVQDRDGFNPAGRMLTDTWIMPFLSTTSSERLGYEGQKPERLLVRILELFTDPGDTVLDFFAGSGTTAAAASTLGRNSILVDENPEAVSLGKLRA